MTKPVAYTITFVVCLLLQVAVAPAIAIGGCSPNFLFIFVLLVALRSGIALGSVAGFACGLFEDLAGSGVVGSMALAFTLVALIVGAMGSAMELGSPFASCVIAVLFSIVNELAYGILSALTSAEGGGVLATMLGYALPTAIYTAVFACIALATISLVLIDDTPSMPSRLSGGLGASGSPYIFRSK